MKIKELADITGINPETIRMYRNMHFLHPEKLDNGYYEYTMDDYVSLIYLRKLRELNLTLEEADTFEHVTSHDKLIDMLNEKDDEIIQKIDTLSKLRHYLSLEKRHIHDTYTYETGKAYVMQSVDEKIDMYEPFPIPDTAFYLFTTPTVFISKDVLNGEISNKTIPLKTGIGTYRYLMKKHHFTIPENAIIIPNGICIAEIVSLSHLDEISVDLLAPMILHARKLKRPFVSDATGYLMRIHHENGNRIYDFRIRACISINDIVDPEAL